MGSSSIKMKNEPELKIIENNTKENEILIKDKNEETLNKIKVKLEKNDENIGKKKLTPLNTNSINNIVLKQNLTNVESKGEEINENKIENGVINNKGIEEEINDNNIINTINIKKDEEIKKKEENKKENKLENNSDVDEEIFKPIAQLELNRKSIMKKTRYRGITFVQNLKEFFPEDISKEEIRTMVINALSDNIVNNDKYIPGKNITKEQSEKLVEIVYNKIKNNDDDYYENENKKEYDFKSEKYKILEDLKIKIGMSDLNKNITKKLFYKDKENVNDEDLERTMKNLCQGNENVKILIIEML